MQNQKNILITTSSFGKTDPTPLERLEHGGFNVILNPFGRKLTETEVLSLLEKHTPCALLAGVEPLTARVLNSVAPHLKTIARCGIGMDSVDLAAASALGISVTNTPDAPTIPVAELTMGMMLGLLRQIHLSDASIRKNQWKRPMGRLLHGKTVGIIGCGRIGTQLARMLQGFGCDILGADPAIQKSERFKLVEVDALLDKSDIVTLHLPYSQETHHFMNKNRLERMKPDALLINASRGGLVDEAALYDFLNQGKLGGAALDCFENEPYNGPLNSLNNTLLTAHIGSYAKEGRIMMENQAVDHLIQELTAKGFI